MMFNLSKQIESLSKFTLFTVKNNNFADNQREKMKMRFKKF